jgi:hypothetical protein
MSPPTAISNVRRQNRDHSPARNFISLSFQSLTRFFLATPFAATLSWPRKGLSAFSKTGYFSHDKLYLQTRVAPLEPRPSPHGKN